MLNNDINPKGNMQHFPEVLPPFSAALADSTSTKSRMLTAGTRRPEVIDAASAEVSWPISSRTASGSAKSVRARSFRSNSSRTRSICASRCSCRAKKPSSRSSASSNSESAPTVRAR
jgi:hypothetical protein